MCEIYKIYKNKINKKKQGIKDGSKAILDMDAGLSRSIEMLSQGLSHGYPPESPHPVNQNIFYQYPVQYMSSHASYPNVHRSNKPIHAMQDQSDESDETMYN